MGRRECPDGLGRFQYLMVQLKVHQRGRYGVRQLQFQYLMVQLKEYGEEAAVPLTLFQYLMVQLKVRMRLK